jgi:hypothetical protein
LGRKVRFKDGLPTNSSSLRINSAAAISADWQIKSTERLKKAKDRPTIPKVIALFAFTKIVRPSSV